MVYLDILRATLHRNPKIEVCMEVRSVLTACCTKQAGRCKRENCAAERARMDRWMNDFNVIATQETFLLFKQFTDMFASLFPNPRLVDLKTYPSVWRLLALQDAKMFVSSSFRQEIGSNEIHSLPKIRQTSRIGINHCNEERIISGLLEIYCCRLSDSARWETQFLRLDHGFFTLQKTR